MMADYLLGDIVEFIGGGTPDKSKPEYWNGPIPWASVKDFKSSHLTQTQDFISDEGLKSSASKLIPPDTVIIPTRMAVGRAAINSKPMAINQDLKALKPKIKLETKFLLHLMLANASILISKATGATVQGIRLEHLKSLKVSIPPLEEQKRIAGILDAAEDLRQKRQRSLELLDELKQSIFWETFFQSTDGTKTRVKLAEVVDFRSSQVDPKRQPYSEMLHVGPEHIASNTGEISWQNVRTATEDGVKSGKYKFESGDLIYSKIRPYLNKVAVADREGICSADMYALHNPQKITIGFLHFLLMSNDFLNYAETLSNRANIPKLNRGQLSEYEFDLPSKASLQVFSKKMKNLDEVAKQLLLSTTKIDELFTSLQHKAFAGELLGTAA